MTKARLRLFMLLLCYHLYCKSLHTCIIKYYLILLNLFILYVIVIIGTNRGS